MNRLIILVLILITLVVIGVTGYRLLIGQDSQATLITEQGSQKLTDQELQALEQQLNLHHTQPQPVAGSSRDATPSPHATLKQINRINQLNQHHNK